MPYIQLRDRQYPIGKGQLRVGTSAYADVRVPGPESDSPQAIVDIGADNQAAIRRGSPEAAVKVNGVTLGAEPAPLLHGDKIEIAGVELLYGDDRAAGSTQYLGTPRAAVRAPVSVSSGAPATAGRLVSQVDGREYPITGKGVTIGRDASCEVVVPSTEVSRRHAMITPSAEGYILTDLSTNGVLVNGERVTRTRPLTRGDIIRIGMEEFRFHADAVASSLPPEPSGSGDADRTPTPQSTVAAGTSGAGALGSSAAPAGADAPVHPAARAEEASGAAAGQGAPASRRVLALLEIVNEGVLKGKRFEIRTPLVHIGRGSHNDVCVPDDSVSDSHAKIQKRETGWHVVDMDSTNGTYVGGRRISGDRQLVGSPDIRFGGIKMIFHVAADAQDDVKGTRAIAGLRPPVRPGTPSRPAAPSAPPIVVEPVEEPRARGLGWVWIGIIVLVLGTLFFVIWGGR